MNAPLTSILSGPKNQQHLRPPQPVSVHSHTINSYKYVRRCDIWAQDTVSTTKQEEVLEYDKVFIENDKETFYTRKSLKNMLVPLNLTLHATANTQDPVVNIIFLLGFLWYAS